MVLKYLLNIVWLLIFVSLSKAAITIENDNSKLKIAGFISLYADTGDSIGNIANTFAANDLVSRLNFGFTHKESDSLTSVGYISIGMDTTAEYGDSNNPFFERYRTYVGLEHNVLGTVYLGTMTSVNYKILVWTDIRLPNTGDEHSEWLDGDKGTKRGVGYVEDAIFYTKNFQFSSNQNLDVFVQAQGAENNYTQENAEGNGLRRKSGSAVGFIYNLDKFSIGLTDSFAKIEQEGTLDILEGNSLGFGMRYQGEKLYLALTASRQENLTAMDTNNLGIELAADYKIGDGYGLLMIYGLRQIIGGSTAKAEGLDGYNDIHLITLTAYKKFPNKFKIYIQGKMDLRTTEEKNMFISSDDFTGTNENSLSFGMEYVF